MSSGEHNNAKGLLSMRAAVSRVGVAVVLAVALAGPLELAGTAQAATPGARVVASAATARKPGKPGTPKVTSVANHTVRLSWSAAKANGAAIGKYQVKDSRGRLTACKVRTCRITGLTNGASVKFRVRAHNRKGWGAWSSWSKAAAASAKPLGLAVAEPKPDRKVGATANVRVAWSLSSPNGPKPMSYSVMRSDGKRICTAVSGTSCTDDAVRFDGKTYRYSVTATNATGGSAHSSSATSPTWVAVGTPDAWVSWTAAATGSSGQATLGYAVPASRGGASTVTLLNNGAPFKALGAASTAGQLDSYTITGLGNGATYAFSLRVCNEQRCSTSSPRSVTPFGPLAKPSVSASASGATVSASATANGNGAFATLSLYVDGDKVAEESGTGALHVAGSKTVGYSHTATVIARLTSGSTDPQRGDGGEDFISIQTGGQ